MGSIHPLYPEATRLIKIERTSPLDSAEGKQVCRRCALHKVARPSSVCMPTGAINGGVGGVLVVGEVPGKHEDAIGMPFVGEAGRLLRNTVEAHWDGPVAYTNALLCYPGDKPDSHTSKKFVGYVGTCRSYLAHTIQEVKPKRIIALGSVAALALLGRTVPPFSVRKGFAFTSEGIPIYLGINPEEAINNRFVRRWFVEDIEWALTSEIPVPSEFDADFRMVDTAEDAERACEELRAAPWFAYDTEYAGRPYDSYFEVLSLAACPKGSDEAIVWSREALLDPARSEPLFRLMRDKRVRKVGHNIKVDLLALRAEFGVDVKGTYMCTANDRRLLLAGAQADLATTAETIGMGGHKLEAETALGDALAEIGEARAMHRAALRDLTVVEVLKLPGFEHPAVKASCRLIDLGPRTFAYALLPKPVLHRYNALDAVATTRLGEDQERKLAARPHLQRISRKVVTPAAKAYEQIEAWGIGASIENMRDLNTHLVSELADINVRFERLGSSFNPASRDDIAWLMFNRLGIEPREKDKTSSGLHGTGAKIIKRYSRSHPILHSVLEHRRISKLLGTYSNGLIQHVRADGRIHSNFKITGTETGRPSCTDPNLQNFPRASTFEGALARNCLVAADGCFLLEVDYSQMEIRVGAMLSGDVDMIGCYLRGEDLHWKTTRLISQEAWGIAPELTTEDHRTLSKVFTFGLMYGKTDAGLAEELGITLEKAGDLRRAILGAYPGFNAWCQAQIKRVQHTGETFTWWDGHRARARPLWQIGDLPVDGRPTRRSITARNSAINTPIQGTASEYCVASAVEVVKACILGHIPAKVVVTIHDAIVLECAEDRVDEVGRKVGAIMTSWPTLAGMPLVVDFKRGRAMGSLKAYKIAA